MAGINAAATMTGGLSYPRAGGRKMVRGMTLSHFLFCFNDEKIHPAENH